MQTLEVVYGVEDEFARKGQDAEAVDKCYSNLKIYTSVTTPQRKRQKSFAYIERCINQRY